MAPHFGEDVGFGGGPTGDAPARNTSTPTEAVRDAVTNAGTTTPEGAAAEEEERDGWAAFPFFTYAPETDLGLGAFGIYFFRFESEATETRPSSIAVDALGTTRGQVLAEIIPEFYWDGERFNLWSRFDFRLYPDEFYGVGPDTPEVVEPYSSMAFRGAAWLRRTLWQDLSAGVRAEGQHFEITERPENGLFDREDIRGEDGGFLLGLGLTLDWDTRDNAVESHSGSYFMTQLMTWQKELGSDYAFTRLTVDLRQFVELHEGHALGFQLYSEMNFGSPPFYQMARIGGPSRMRGYYDGRYVDQTSLVAQMEYRFPIFWRFRGVVFASAGDVAPSIDEFDFLNVEVAGGAGLRFQLDPEERLNLRLDFGFSPESWGAYVYVAEAF